jgi:hypothetical protein
MNDGVHLEFNQQLISSSPIRGFDQIPDIMTMEIPAIQWLVDGMIARNTMTLWTGADGTAKTFLAQKMAISVARGMEFLGRRCQLAPVLYLDYENPSFAVRERLDLMAGGPIAGLKVWGTWNDQQPPQIGSELLLTIAKETKPLIILDPFRYAHGEEENESTPMMNVMQCLRYCAAAGGAVVILHHPARSEGSTGRGSTVIKGGVDLAYLQEMSDETGLITLACTKNRFGERHSVTIRPDYDEGTFEVTDSPQFTKRSVQQEKLQQIIATTPGVTQNGVFQKSGMGRNRVIDLLKSGNGTLWEEREEREHGRRSLHYYPVPGSQYNQKYSGTGPGGLDCTGVLPPLRGVHGTTPSRPSLAVPAAISEKPHGKTLPSCPDCGSFALAPDDAGGLSCQTCELKKAEGMSWRN